MQLLAEGLKMGKFSNLLTTFLSQHVMQTLPKPAKGNARKWLKSGRNIIFWHFIVSCSAHTMAASSTMHW